ncbi:hypothetical protein BDE36_1799 [Arcticibacter tournemirensis]|uniref:Uncharacterized protein n=1 Tax=Arcticibacter tournemirensis TaxID=699437 RepID=A0A5M9HBI7_9SPHI|nr:hypothetical protein [Arcticibacter tournemirensis]KAA8483739.1 hypothetical protein F1649_07570 [Arcticibacter tournemirensis]TQM50064.1 hypothetical protein BDE36_1799 [Arcticibacter tournemirensis]
MTKDEIEKNTMYGTLFSADTFAEYAEALGTIFGEQGKNYERNACSAATKAAVKLRNAIDRTLTAGLAPEQKELVREAIEHNKDQVYEFFTLSAEHQSRVTGLIKKLKRDEAKMQLVREEAAA